MAMRQPVSAPTGIRANGLWGRGARVAALVGAVACAVAVGAGSAAAASPKSAAFVPAQLLQQAQQSPSQTFDVIVRGVPGEKSASIATYFTQGHTAPL